MPSLGQRYAENVAAGRVERPRSGGSASGLDTRRISLPGNASRSRPTATSASNDGVTTRLGYEVGDGTVPDWPPTASPTARRHPDHGLPQSLLPRCLLAECCIRVIGGVCTGAQQTLAADDLEKRGLRCDRLLRWPLRTDRLAWRCRLKSAGAPTVAKDAAPGGGASGVVEVDRVIGRRRVWGQRRRAGLTYRSGKSCEEFGGAAAVG